MGTSFFNWMGLHPTRRGQYLFISMRISQRDRSSIVEMKTVFWWNGCHSHWTYPYVISFYGRYVKGLVYVPSLPASIDKLKQRIISPLDNITGDMLQYVWQELNNQLDMCCVTGSVHIEHLWNRSQNKLMMFNTKTVQFRWARCSSF